MAVFEIIKYLSNHCSNEKVHNTKVVDLEKLSKSGIQHIFIWSQEEGENSKLQNWVLELWSNYEIATDRFFHLRLPAPRLRRRPYAGAGHLAAPRVAPPPKTAPAPLVCVAPLPAGDPPSSTRACASPSRQAAGHLWPPLPGQLAPSSPSPDSPSPSPWAYKRQNSSSFRAPEPCPPSTAPPWPASAGAPWTTPIHPSSAPTEPLNGFLSEI